MKSWSRAIGRALAALTIFCFLSYLATEGPDYLSGPRPPEMPDFLYPLFFPLFMPLTFIVGFSLVALL